MKTTIISSSEDKREAFYEAFFNELSAAFKDQTVAELFFLATIEAINNAAEHGNQNLVEKRIIIQYALFQELIVLSVTDEGPGFVPVFPNLKQVRGARGRGLALIKKYTDILLFNETGNQITLIKGTGMKIATTDHSTINHSEDGMVALITDLDLGKGTFQSHRLMDIFDKCEKFGPPRKQFFFDLNQTDVLSSTAWGIFFTENENHIIVLFNTNTAIRTIAEAMGVAEREDCEKFLIYEGVQEVIDFLPVVLGEEYNEAKNLFESSLYNAD